MNDCFALLGEARRPWLEPEALKRKFIARAAEVHPDRAHQAGSAARADAQQRSLELNAAYQRLRDPKARLEHLLELERGTRPAPVLAVPADLLDLFMETARVCRETDEFLAENARVTSPLLKVRMFERAQGWRDRLMGLQHKITRKYEGLLAELQELDSAWCARADTADRQGLLAPADDLCRRLSFFSRWQAQVQERLAQLAA